MDIRHLYTRTNGEVFAVELLDGTESYPVFLESLGNTIILPELLNSGWALVGLPLDLRKNGVSLMSYPRHPFTPTPEQEQEMYDLMGEELSMAERTKMVTVASSNAASMREASFYLINTREEFISYLRGIRLDGLRDDDYAPLNCFVAPSARFSLNEFVDPANAEFRDIINSRRRYNPSRFNSLLKFLNVSDSGWDPFQLAKAYFQWGLDGVSATLSEPTSMPLYERYGGKGDPSIKRITERHYVVAKADGTVLTPGIDPTLLREQSAIQMFSEDRGEPRRMTFSESESNQLNTLSGPDQGAVLIRYSYSKQDALIYKVLDPDSRVRRITLTQESIVLDTTPMSLFMVNDGNSAVAMSDLANPERARLNSYLKALARDFHDKRKTQFEATTCQGLLEAGCSPLSALNHARFFFGWNVPGSITDENDVPIPANDPASVITWPELMAFVKGDMSSVPELHQDLLKDFIYGSLNYTDLQQAISVENNDNVDRTYRTLWAAHFCLNIPLAELEATVSDWTSGPLVLKGERATLTIPDIKLNSAGVAYNKFISDLRNEQAKDPQAYLWVDTALEALGDDKSRHIGALVSYMPRTNAVTAAIDWIRMRYIDMVLDAAAPFKTNLNDALRYSQLCFRYLGPAPYAHMEREDPICRYNHTGGCVHFVAAQALFSGLKTGVVKIPVPGRKDAVTIDVKNGTAGFEQWKAKFDDWATQGLINPGLNAGESYYVSLSELCDGAISPYDPMWNYYSCNAVITQDKITPRRHFTVNSCAFCTAARFADVFNQSIPAVKQYWDAYRPALMQNMDFMFYLQKNAINALPNTRYLRSVLEMPDGVGYSLKRYQDACTTAAREWKSQNPTLRCTSFTHPKDICYPCTDTEEDEDYDGIIHGIGDEPLHGDERGLPGFVDRIGFNVLQYEPAQTLPPKVIPPIRRYRGLTTADFRQGVGAVEFPPTSGTKGAFIIRHGAIAVHDGTSVRLINAGDVQNLDQSAYPVRHLCGNRYLVRDHHKDLWVVEV